MCLIAVAWRVHPRYELALIANRDERHARASAAAGFHVEAPEVYGGRDLEAGGSWLLVSTRRRLAAVTNVRAGRPETTRPRSRGALTDDFVRGEGRADAMLAALAPQAHEYGRFNLLAWDGERLAVATNHPGFETRLVEPGLHAMSNGAFDAPWPKASHAVAELRAWLDSPVSRVDQPDPAPLFRALADTTPAPDAALPDTGVGVEIERFLSPPFILGADYGTRCSTVVLVDTDGIAFFERRFAPGGAPLGERDATLPLEAP